MTSFNSMLGLESSEELQKQLDVLRADLNTATRNYEILQKRHDLQKRYSQLWESFRADVLAPRLDFVAHGFAGIPTDDAHRSQRDRHAGRYDELADLMKTTFQTDNELHAALMARHDLMGRIVKVEQLISKAQKREEQKVRA